MKLPWPILLVALALPTIGAIGYFVLAAPDDPIFQVVYGGSKVVQFALPVAWLLIANRNRLKAVRFSVRGVGGGVAFGLLTAIAILGLYGVALRGGPTFVGVADAVREKVNALGLDSPTEYVGLAFFLSVIHSFLEEYYWRWFVHSGLRERLPQASAIALSSLAFAAHHIVVLDVYFPGRLWSATLPFTFGVAVGGAVWAWWYERTGSLAGPWVAHAGADIAITAIGYDLLYGIG